MSVCSREQPQTIRFTNAHFCLLTLKTQYTPKKKRRKIQIIIIIIIQPSTDTMKLESPLASNFFILLDGWVDGLFTWNTCTTMQLKKVHYLSELFFILHMDLIYHFFSKWLSLATWLQPPLHKWWWIILLKLWAFWWTEDQVWKAWGYQTAADIWFYSLLVTEGSFAVGRAD